MVDELPPDDPNTPDDESGAPGSRRRARRRDRAARIVGARTAEDLTAERPRPVIPESPAAPPPPVPPSGDVDGDVDEDPDAAWQEDEAGDDAWDDEAWEDDAESLVQGQEEWAEQDSSLEQDDELWEDAEAGAIDQEPTEEASHFGAIPVIRPGDPPPPGVEIPPQPGAGAPAGVSGDDDAWDDEEWEDDAAWASEDAGGEVLAFGSDDVPQPPAPREDAEWEPEADADQPLDQPFDEGAWEEGDEEWDEPEPTAAMAPVPPPPPPPPPPPHLEEVPPVELDELDEPFEETAWDEGDEEWDEPEAPTADAAWLEEHDGYADDDALAEGAQDQHEPGPPPLRLADDPPPDEPPPDPWDPAVGEVHDDVSGMPPDDDDLLSSPRGWDDEDDGLDALIPRRTGQTEAIDPEAPPPAPAEPDLPPWTEPGTGEVPAAVRGEDDDLDAWSGISHAPRWRDQSDEAWESEGFDDLGDVDQTEVGGYEDELEDEELVVFDDVARAPSEDPGLGHDPYPSDPRRGGLLGGGGPPPQEPGSDARDLPVAVGVGVGLAVAFLVLMNISPGATMLLIVPALVLAAAEFYTAVRKAGYVPINLLGIVAVAGLALGTFWRGTPAMPLVLFLAVVAGLLWYLFNPAERVVPNLGITMLGVLWIGLLGSFAALIVRFPQDGTGVLAGAIVVTVAHDVVGLVVGSRMGRSPLSAASPGKTMEGTIGGVAAAIVAGLLVGVLLEPWSPATGIMLGIVAGVVAPLGDLAESVLKRDLGIKDMGSLLPGHGGLLDRFDALLFVLPAAYYVAVLNDLVF